jgi:hypothetical protein
VDAFLHILGLVLFILGVIGLSAGITWAVVKLSPTKDKAKKSPATP